MINKKLLAGIMSGALMISLLTGCQNKAQTPAAGGEKKTSDFPNKTITMVVPVAAGGSSDIIGRAMANYSQKYFKQPMVVSNVAGGASTLGTAEVVTAKADGYTLAFPPVGAVSVQPHYGQINYTYSDLTPIAQVSEEAIVLVVPKGKYKDLADFVQASKTKAIKYGQSSTGGPVHIVMEKLFSDAGGKGDSIGYKGNAEVKAALLGGHIDAGTLHPSEVLPVLKSGDVQALAVSTSTGKRDPSLPDVPTFKELGYDITYTVWKGVFGPKNLPADVKASLVDGFEKILKDPDFVKEMANIGQQVSYLGPDEFSKKIEKEYNDYGVVIDKTGMKAIVTGQK